MKEKLKKFIGSKEFYKRFFMIVIPIMAQQLLVSLAGYVDNLMINSYGGIEFAAAYNGVSAANRVMFIFNFVWLGTATTASIFIAQYFGAKNQDKINEAFRLSIYVAVIFGVVSFAIIAFFGNFFVDAFVQDSAARAYGYDYIQVIKWGTVITALILCLETAFRTIKQPIIALIAAVSGIVVNIFFNYCYIFGNFGFPELAAEGAAIATVISRVVELGILILALIVKRKKFFTGFAKKITVGKDAIRAYVKKGIPLIMNELMWSFGIILMTLFCTWHNDLWYTAYSYSQNISDLFFIIFAGLGNGVGIVIGEALGAGDFERAILESKQLQLLSIVMGIVMGILMVFISPYILMLFQPTPEIKKLSMDVLYITAVFVALYSYNSACFFMLRAGGDSIRAFVLDQTPTYLAIGLAALLGTHAKEWGLTMPIIFLITHIGDIMKAFIATLFVRGKHWVINLTVGAKKVLTEEEKLKLDNEIVG